MIHIIITIYMMSFVSFTAIYLRSVLVQSRSVTRGILMSISRSTIYTFNRVEVM